MILSPETFLDKLILPQETYITFHVETESNIETLITKIKQKGWRPGIAANPETSIEAVFPFLDRLEQILIMSVHPGFSGQKLIPSTLDKIPLLKNILSTRKLNIPIAIDGGITQDNISKIHALGASQFGIASGIFCSDNPADQLKHLYALQ